MSEQMVWINYGLVGVLAFAAFVYLRKSLEASADRLKSDALAQVARQSTEKVFDEKLLRQLDERDKTLADERTSHAAEIAEKKAELTALTARNQLLNDRYYQQMEKLIRLQADTSVIATQHNLEVTKAVQVVRDEAHTAMVRVHAKVEEQGKQIVECLTQHADCTSRLSAIESSVGIKPTPTPTSVQAVVTTTVSTPAGPK